MNVVEFSEGILGLDKISGPIVAKCLRSMDQDENIALVASTLESGGRVDIGLIRNIGEDRLTQARLMCLNS